MATAKSVVEIDVESESFKEFYSLYSKYEDALKKMPGDWGKVSAAYQASLSAQKRGMAEGIADTQKRQKAASETVRQQNELTRATKNSDTAMKSVERTAKSVSEYVERTTFQLLKWAALGGGIGGGVLGGVAALANAGSQQRADSRLLGINTGQLSAARDVYGPMGLNPDGVLGNIRAWQTDPRRQGFLQRLGISMPDILGKTPGDLLPQVLSGLARASANGPINYEGNQFGGLLDFQQANMLRNLPKGELEERGHQYLDASKRLNRSDSDVKSMQDAMIAIGLASDALKTLFTPAVVAASKGATRLANYLQSDDFGKDLHDQVDPFLKFDGFNKVLSDPQSVLQNIPGMDAAARAGRSLTAPLFQKYDDWHNRLRKENDLKNLSPQRLRDLYGEDLSLHAPRIQYDSEGGLFGAHYGYRFTGPGAGGAPSSESISDIRNKIRRMTAAQINAEADREEQELKARGILRDTGGGINSISDVRALYSRSAQIQQTPLVTGKILIENNTGGNATTTATLLAGH